MTYREFNKKALDYYISRSSTTFFTLSLDSQEFNSIISVNEIDQFHMLRTSWNSLTDIRDGIPQYFGLIAIQCYAASLMHQDEINAADAYQIRLCEILKIANTGVLQNLFKGGNVLSPIQEEIWHNAKAYLGDNLNQKLDIPQRTYYAGRYVQYPKSQALLTTEDLKYFTQFFAEDFQVNEVLSLDFFKNKLEARFEYIHRTPRAIKLWDDEEKRERCIKQVYDYYNFWDGQIFTPLVKKTNRVVSRDIDKRSGVLKLILVFQNGEAKFYTNTQEGLDIKEVSQKEIFQIKGYHYIHKNLIIFNEFDYYPGEYEDSRFLYSSVKSLILLDSNARSREYAYLEKNHDYKIELSSNLMLYKCNSGIDYLSSPLNSFIQTIRPVFLRGGLKINRKNDYLKGFGPSIICTKKFDIIYEYQKCDYNSELAKAGLYKVRTDNFRDFEFCIVEKAEPLITVESKQKGWNLNTYLVGENYNIEGCYIHVDLKGEISPVRKWINANMKRKRRVPYVENNILIKALYNSAK